LAALADQEEQAMIAKMPARISVKRRPAARRRTADHVNACEAARSRRLAAVSESSDPAGEDVEGDDRHRDDDHRPAREVVRDATKIPSMTAIPRAIFSRRE
jgi:hypothetical protein